MLLSNLVELLEQRSVDHPSATFSFVANHEERADATVTFHGLARRARAIAVRLRALATHGERAVLCFPPGLSFIEAFFGCIYAGLISVPAEIPRRGASLLRVRTIAADADAAIVLTTAANYERIAAAVPVGGGRTKCFATDLVEDKEDVLWKAEGLPASGEVAYLQYTSGSTSSPRGVEISHSAVLANLRDIDSEFQHHSESVSVSWLPHYHDMGLVYGILQPVFNGFDATLISPTSFVQEPSRWLKTIARVKATHSGGPDFGYAHCVRSINEADIGQLDLSTWRVAFSGAERVHRETMEAFAEKFAPSGFRPSAFYPSYGLAEATLKVTCRSRAKPVTYRRPVTAKRAYGEYTSCGVPGPSTQVIVVDPKSYEPLPEGHVGEVWVQSPSVASGYWRHPELSETVFGGRLHGDNKTTQSFLRTGDLGFLLCGELHIAGRLKDLIIVNGKNYHPEDIEAAVTTADAELRGRRCVAFSVNGVAGEELVVLLESASKKSAETHLLSLVRRAVADATDLAIQHLAVVVRGALPITSSGKVRRSSCRERWLEGSLPVIAAAIPAAAVPDTEPNRAMALRRAIAECLTVSTDNLDPELPLHLYGIASLRAVNLQVLLANRYGIDVSIQELLSGMTMRDLSSRIDVPHAPRVLLPLQCSDSPGKRLYRASLFQRRIWELNQVARERSMLSLVRRVRLAGPVNVPALAGAFADVVRRHRILKSTFALNGSELWVREGLCEPHLLIIDLRGLEQNQLDAALRQLERQFQLLKHDLERGPLVTAVLALHHTLDASLLWSTSHAVADGHSVGIIEEELSGTYSAYVRGEPWAAEITPAYSTFAEWQIAQSQTPKALEQTTRIAQSLRGVQSLKWRPALEPRAGIIVDRVRYIPEQRADMEAFCRGVDVSMFMLLLCAFELTLTRYTGQADFAVSFPIDCRLGAEYSRTVGCFANRTVSRAQLQQSATAADHLQAVRSRVLQALDCRSVTINQLTQAIAKGGEDTDLRALSQLLFQFWPAERAHFARTRSEVAYLTPTAAAFDIVVSAESADDLSVEFLFSSLRFDSAGARMFIESWQQTVADLLSSRRNTDPLQVASLQESPADTQILQVTVLSDFVAEGIRESMVYWMNQLSVTYKLHFAPVGQVMQYLLDLASMSDNSRHVLLLLLQAERWQTNGGYDADLLSVSAAVESFARRVPRMHIVTLFGMPSPPRKDDQLLHDCEQHFADTTSSADVVCSRVTERFYPVDDYFDDYTNQLAQIPYKRHYYAALGTMAARRIEAYRRRERKLIIVDADNTLWSGISAEQGALSVAIDAAKKAFQRFLLQQRESGRLLALCSKNNQADVFDVLDFHPGMLLRREHFTTFRINWRSKSESLADIAEELGFDPGAIIFIDDNPVECAEVQSSLPTALAVNLPHDEREPERFLGDIWDFDVTRVTVEDRLRAVFYAQNAARADAERIAPTLDEYLASLELEIQIEPLPPSGLGRASQLTHRTTQFNLNGQRYSEGELNATCCDKVVTVLSVRANDRFGDYGMVGLLAYQLHNGLSVELFLLSCRALGKRIEHRMALRLAEAAEQTGIQDILFRFESSERNAPIRTFLQEIGANTEIDGHIWVQASRVRAACMQALSPFAGVKADLKPERTRHEQIAR